MQKQIPEGESGFVHLHADEEGVLRELYSGDEVQGDLCLKTYFHSSAYEVCVYSHVTDDDQCSPVHRVMNELSKYSKNSRVSAESVLVFGLTYHMRLSGSMLSTSTLNDLFNMADEWAEWRK